jgi:hypothetical protein
MALLAAPQQGRHGMTGRPEKIVIAPEDLRDPRVDAALAQQVSFGMGAPPAPVEDRRTGLIYRPWFALMLAGGLGAFLAWALIEPVFSDGIEFSGAVQSGALPTADGEFSTLGVAGVDVLVSRPFTIVQDDRPPEAAGSFDHTIAHVRGESIESGQFVAAEVHLTPGDAGDAPPPDLAAVGRRQTLVGLFVFPLIAALVGLFIGAADGVLSRARRRALLCGSVGLGLGLAVGLVAALLSTVLYWVGSTIAAGLDTAGPGGMSAGALVVQMMARGLAWAAAGIGMGLGQGIALRSPRLLVNGLVGGVVGGLLGGLLFDPIDYVVHGGSFGSGGAEVSRAVGFTVIGMCTGLMIGVVELLAREA